MCRTANLHRYTQIEDLRQHSRVPHLQDAAAVIAVIDRTGELASSTDEWWGVRTALRTVLILPALTVKVTITHPLLGDAASCASTVELLRLTHL